MGGFNRCSPLAPTTCTHNWQHRPTLRLKIGGLRNNPNRLHLPLFTFNYFCISNPLLLTHCAEVWKLFSQYTRCTLDVIPFRLQSVNPRNLGSLETVLSIHSVRSGFNSFQTAAISESCLQLSVLQQTPSTRDWVKVLKAYNVGNCIHVMYTLTFALLGLLKLLVFTQCLFVYKPQRITYNNMSHSAVKCLKLLTLCRSSAVENTQGSS